MESLYSTAEAQAANMSSQAVTPFNFQGSQVRTVTIDGQPWFVAKDVCATLGISNHNDATGRIGISMKSVVGVTDPHGREQDTLILNEAGVYKLAFRSNKPEAEAFTDWIAVDVLPAIRKTGTYTAPIRPDWVIPQTYADALMLAGQQAKALEAAKPKVEFYDAVVADDSWFSMQRAAGVLNIVGLGRNNLFKFLRDWEVFTSSSVPYRRYIDQGYFRLQDVRTPVGMKAQPMVSQRGIDFILRQWNKNHAVAQ